jgi:hypothetical protein
VSRLVPLIVGGVVGGPKCSPLAPLMIAAGVAVHLLLVVGSALDEASGRGGPTCIHGYSVEYPLFLQKNFIYIVYPRYIYQKIKEYSSN